MTRHPGAGGIRQPKVAEGEPVETKTRLNYAFNETTNQINSPGFQYDPDGNLTSDGSHSYQYDAEGHLTGIDNGSTASFSYNAVGQRVEDKWSYQLEFQYDLFGHLVGSG